MILTIPEAINWGNSLRKVTSVRHRNILLRVAHGDIYTKVKLAKYGLSEDPLCPRCGEIETLQHKFFSCDYTRRIWSEALSKTNKLKHGTPINIPIENEIIGATTDTSPIILSIHAEIMVRILALRPESNYLLLPSRFVNLAIKSIAINERSLTARIKCESLLA